MRVLINIFRAAKTMLFVAFQRGGLSKIDLISLRAQIFVPTSTADRPTLWRADHALRRADKAGFFINRWLPLHARIKALLKQVSFIGLLILVKVPAQ
jgi:hypothetical protein